MIILLLTHLLSAMALADMPSRYITLQGERYKIIESYNSHGTVTRQILIGKNKTMFWLDPRGTGHMDYWESITPDQRLSLSEPDNGHFQVMDIEQKMRSSRVEMHFRRDHRSGEFV